MTKNDIQRIVLTDSDMPGEPEEAKLLKAKLRAAWDRQVALRLQHMEAIHEHENLRRELTVLALNLKPGAAYTYRDGRGLHRGVLVPHHDGLHLWALRGPDSRAGKVGRTVAIVHHYDSLTLEAETSLEG